jgi:hypothetical protein
LPRTSRGDSGEREPVLALRGDGIRFFIRSALNFLLLRPATDKKVSNSPELYLFNLHCFHKHNKATKRNRGSRQRFEVERVVINALTKYIAHHPA